jgi:hypothetical protein
MMGIFGVFSVILCSAVAQSSSNEPQQFYIAPSAPTGPWQAIASSESGQYLADVYLAFESSVSNYHLYVYTSSNYGVTWTPTKVSNDGNIPSVANYINSDSSGRYLLAGGSSDYVYVSVDYGVTWSSWVNTQSPGDRLILS